MVQSQYSDGLDLLPTSDRLCEACQKILHFTKASHFHLPQLEGADEMPCAALESHTHHAKEADLRESAQNGCCVCSVLLRRWITKCQEDPDLTVSPEWSEEEDDEDDCSGKSKVNGKNVVDN